MDAKTLKALKASIEKWERNAVAETPDGYLIGPESCALCRLFHDSGCHGCPVRGRTGRVGCLGTPYFAASKAQWGWRLGGSTPDEAHTAAREEVAFLKSLLPEGA